MILQNGMERLKNLSLDRYSPRDAINVRSQKIERKKLAILSYYSFHSNVNNLGIDFRGNSAGLRKLRGPLLRIGVHRRA